MMHETSNQSANALVTIRQYADIVVFCDESGAKEYADKPQIPVL
jgi:hypothetical protein